MRAIHGSVAVLRAVAVLLLVILHIPAASIASLVSADVHKARIAVRGVTLRLMMAVLGLRVVRRGVWPEVPCILVCNHRSYLDPLPVLRDSSAMPVAKAEIAGWPIIGRATRLSGILFVRRDSSSDRRRVLGDIAAALREGYTVLIFPEGTTGAQPSPLEFRRGVFRLAAEEGFPIVPMALDYPDPADYWVDDDTLVRHFLSRFGFRRVRCDLRVGEPMLGTDSEALRLAAREWMVEALDDIRASWKKEGIALR
jgi:1-acyl-sn-glycerol-3-phosphate acyltransferase